MGLYYHTVCPVPSFLAVTVDLGFLNTMIMCCNLQIPISCLTEFLSAVENGYCKYNNPYHSHVHAADVTQTLHCLLLRSGLVVQSSLFLVESFIPFLKDEVVLFLYCPNCQQIPLKEQKPTMCYRLPVCFLRCAFQRLNSFRNHLPSHLSNYRGLCPTISITLNNRSHIKPPLPPIYV